jgi:hypothetical protein
MSTPDQMRKVVQECGYSLIETFMANKHVLRTPCFECLYFDRQKELCKAAAPPQRPPIRVLTYGCSNWKEDPDLIPF